MVMWFTVWYETAISKGNSWEIFTYLTNDRLSLAVFLNIGNLKESKITFMETRNASFYVPSMIAPLKEKKYHLVQPLDMFFI